MGATPPRILITGKNGQLGWALARSFGANAEVHALDRNGLNLADTDAIRRCCREIKPTLILNAAAYTAVDRAEQEPELAMQINGQAPRVLAEEANRLDAAIIHYSTDYVFAGDATEAYLEDDPTAPQNIYGKTKLVGEQAVCEVADRFLVYRTSWVYAARRQNFLLTMLRLAMERDELRVVADQIGSPTWVETLADFTHAAVDAQGHLTIADGIYHVSANGRTSWHAFAEAIFAAIPDPRRTAKRVVPISTADFPTPAKRPAFSVLSNQKIEFATKRRVPDWQEQLAGCAADYAQNA
ncbi:MAG: dTDP-4-dehydrorhamnose reductase [Burkholderiales bacterium]|nr:dTDP-4-dehydrorhamnose reductase [Burkholderiales bacterium]